MCVGKQNARIALCYQNIATPIYVSIVRTGSTVQQYSCTVQQYRTIRNLRVTSMLLFYGSELVHYQRVRRVKF